MRLAVRLTVPQDDSVRLDEAGSLWSWIDLVHSGEAGHWEALFLYNILLFGLLVLKAWRTKRSSAIDIPVIKIMLRDGKSSTVIFKLVIEGRDSLNPRCHLLSVCLRVLQGQKICYLLHLAGLSPSFRLQIYQHTMSVPRSCEKV